MKKLFFLLLLPFFVSAQDGEHEYGEHWGLDFDTAISDAKKDSKNILVYFTGSDWCPPCKMLKKDLFDTAEFENVAKDYELLYVDIPRNKDLLSDTQWKHNQEVLGKYNKKGSFPLIMILNPKGKVLDKYSGYSMTGDVRYHMDLFKKYSD
ncbi:thioredoxin family protein [Maribacter sp. 2-571]|uniref:thioredoxin family protein n=1 Tax=Maribacter sp. 2-571 TaxID=3417569 RepID=UPI003D345105